jgi:hypothetical protein
LERCGNDRMEIQAQILDIKKEKKSEKNPENSQLGKIVCCTERGECLKTIDIL